MAVTQHSWQRSSFSGDGGNNCIEIAATRSTVALRESETPATTLTTNRTALRALLRHVKANKGTAKSA
ncbi:DUF397 domain-containing protein [Streptomyces sp. NPDC050610]|uniref:DUF397 domain-containing protein n=1 Tax=Streptomyces sp. NPDC050610 TaxID=3157097 RepID=UPI0034498946